MRWPTTILGFPALDLENFTAILLFFRASSAPTSSWVSCFWSLCEFASEASGLHSRGYSSAPYLRNCCSPEGFVQREYSPLGLPRFLTPASAGFVAATATLFFVPFGLIRMHASQITQVQELHASHTHGILAPWTHSTHGANAALPRTKHDL